MNPLCFSMKCPFHTFSAGVVFAIATSFLLDKYTKRYNKIPTVDDLISKYKLVEHPEGQYKYKTLNNPKR